MLWNLTDLVTYLSNLIRSCFSFLKNGNNNICFISLLRSILDAPHWFSWELWFPDTCFLYDSRLGLARRGFWETEVKQRGKKGLEAFSVVRCGDGLTAVTDRSQLLLSFLCSASFCLPKCWLCSLAAATSLPPDAWLQTQGPLQAPPPGNPPWAAGHVFFPRLLWELWVVSLR